LLERRTERALRLVDVTERERGEAEPAEPASCRKYRPVIDRRYALDEIVEATRYVETGQKTGNVALRVSDAASGEQPEPPRSTKRKCGRRAVVHDRYGPREMFRLEAIRTLDDRDVIYDELGLG